MGAPFKALLLDVDGTLLDSNEAHARAWVEAFHEANLRVSYEQVRPLIGMDGDQLLPALTDLTKDEGLGQKIDRRRGEIFREKYLPELRPFPRVRELLLQLKEHGFELVVVTSASAEDLEGLLQKAHVADLIDRETKSDDVHRSKPHPDLVRSALHKAGVLSRDALMIGDTPYDVEAALKANVDCLALTCGGWSRDELTAAGAVQVYHDPADLFCHLEESLLGEKAG